MFTSQSLYSNLCFSSTKLSLIFKWVQIHNKRVHWEFRIWNWELFTFTIVSPSVTTMQRKSSAVVSCRRLSSAVVGCRRLSSAVIGCRRLSSAVVGCEYVAHRPRNLSKTIESFRRVSKTFAGFFYRLIQQTYIACVLCLPCLVSSLQKVAWQSDINMEFVDFVFVVVVKRTSIRTY